MGSDERFSAAAGSEPNGFMWHESYTKAMLKMPDADTQARFAMGVIAYGSFGAEPCFCYPLDVAFEGIRPNIDSSRKWSQMGKKGNQKRWGEKDPKNDQKKD